MEKDKNKQGRSSTPGKDQKQSGNANSQPKDEKDKSKEKKGDKKGSSDWGNPMGEDVDQTNQGSGI